jgi:hypothetical protein
MGAKLKSKTHLRNKCFDFLSRFLRVRLQSLKKVLIWPKKSKKVSKMQNFTLISNPLKKLLTTAPKKVIGKTNLMNMSKSEKSAYFRHVFGNNFFWCIFSTLFQRIRNQRKILLFLIPVLYLLFEEKKQLLLLALFKTLIANAQETAQKTENLFLWMCLRIYSNYATIKGFA